MSNDQSLPISSHCWTKSFVLPTPQKTPLCPPCPSTGICVADPLRVQVTQKVSVDVPLPYSVVRGEQIELAGSVYNHLERELKVRGHCSE